MVKVPRLLAILVIGGILASAASASDDFATSTEPMVSQGQPTGTHTAEAGSGESENQPSPVLDHRDRIFYPGDTERPKPLLRKLFLNIVLDQEEIFHQSLAYKSPLCFGVVGADGYNRRIDC
jgi:hypothetical protein